MSSAALRAGAPARAPAPAPALWALDGRCGSTSLRSSTFERFTGQFHTFCAAAGVRCGLERTRACGVDCVVLAMLLCGNALAPSPWHIPWPTSSCMPPTKQGGRARGRGNTASMGPAKTKVSVLAYTRRYALSMAHSHKLLGVARLARPARVAHQRGMPHAARTVQRCVPRACQERDRLHQLCSWPGSTW